LVADTPLLEKDSKTLSRLFPKVNSWCCW
jgi:hypothetical protein